MRVAAFLSRQGFHMRAFHRAFEVILEAGSVFIICLLTAIVVAGFAFRYVGYPLVWYDEVASIMLVWLTYWASALAALKGGHIGVPAVVNALPRTGRLIATAVAEALVILFFVILAVTGFHVVQILQGSTLTSLPWVSASLAQAIIPIGAVLFIIAELLRMPETFRLAYQGEIQDTELREIMEGAEATKQQLRESRA
jgi:C4-dicarboxylate transporter DctQ subunit